MRKGNYVRPDVAVLSIGGALPLMEISRGSVDDGSGDDNIGKGSGDPDDIDAKEGGFSDLWDDEEDFDYPY